MGDHWCACMRTDVLWRSGLRSLTEGRPGLEFSIPVDPAGGVGEKHTLPYWYSLRVALKVLGACDVLFASTCIVWPRVTPTENFQYSTLRDPTMLLAAFCWVVLPVPEEAVGLYLFSLGMHEGLAERQVRTVKDTPCIRHSYVRG